jgi:hypothetical protein
MIGVFALAGVVVGFAGCETHDGDANADGIHERLDDRRRRPKIIIPR